MKSMSTNTQTRKKLIVGNWKMHFNMHESSIYVHKLSDMITSRRGVEVVLCPSFLALQSLSLQINRRQFKLGAQDCYWRDEGPFTGEVSATMLRGIVDYVIVGHSERRHHFHEHDRDIRHKMQAAIRNRLQPILCIGETADERARGETLHVIQDHLTNGLANTTAEELDQLVVAYEPVWAIGTGDDPAQHEVVEAVGEIRSHIKHMFGSAAASNLRVLYGGSVDVDNAMRHLSTRGVDGLLVGGASLQAHAFATIADMAHSSIKKGGEKQ